MENTQLYLEGKCLLLIGQQNNEVSFYCDGFNVLEALNQLNEIDRVNIEELFLEAGEGVSYKSWTKIDFDPVNKLSDLKGIFETLPFEAFIYDLKLTSEKLAVSIHDNREFNISSTSIKIIELTTIVEKLLSSIFGFSNEICLLLITALVENKNKYVLINDKGEILDVYKNFDDYIALNQG